jgi:thiamine-phosphate pyrophosphorylase
LLSRFYPILDTARPLPVLEQVAAFRDAGVRLAQFRHKGPWTEAMLEAAGALVQAVPSAVINDRADIARISGAGTHVGQTDIPAELARRIVGDRMLGLSTHNQRQLEEAAGLPVDYLALGPIFSTRSKENPDDPVGLAELRRLRPLTARPLAAIGGITRENAAAVLDAGADCVAVIGDLYPEPLSASSLRKRIEEWVKLLQ